MKLHLLSLPHTITAKRFSACAFTGKVLRFPRMMKSVGYDVVHYGVEGAEVDCEKVDVMSRDEWTELGGKEPSNEQFGSQDQANVCGKLYTRFNESLVRLLRDRIYDEDVICLPFGVAHRQATIHFPDAIKLETGIGYPQAFCDYRVYESNAWMHYHLGKEHRIGSDYWWVIPNYFDPDERTLGSGIHKYLLYFGRLNQDKGLDVVWEIARHRPDLKVVLCGQGDPSPWLTLPNIEYLSPIHGEGRSKLYGDALCTLMPTRYVEPFGGVAIESMLCGTPVLGSVFGSFTETIPSYEVNGFPLNGFRCRTLSDWLDAIEEIETMQPWPRTQLRADTINRYSMWTLAYEYADVFVKLSALRGRGWYKLEDPRRLLSCPQSL